MNQLIITGASGFLGRNLIEHYIKQPNLQIIALSRTNPNYPQVEWIQADITKPVDNLLPSTSKEATVIHCAAKASDGKLSTNFYNTNVIGTKNALNINPEGKFIHISSSSIYNLTKPSHQVEETEFSLDQYDFLNGYSYTKALAEQLVLNTPRTFPSISLRPHAIYGKGDTTLIPKIKKRIRNGKLLLPNSGNVKHSLTHVGNVIHAVEQAITHTPNISTAYNITDKEPVILKHALLESLPELKTIKHIPLNLVKHLSFLPFVSSYEIQQVGFERTYSIVKAQEELHYAPTFFNPQLV